MALFDGAPVGSGSMAVDTWFSGLLDGGRESLPTEDCLKKIMTARIWSVE